MRQSTDHHFDPSAPIATPQGGRPYLWPILGSTLILAASPFMGRVRDVVLNAVSLETLRIVAGVAALLVVVLLAIVAVRIERRRWLRYGGLALGLLLLSVQIFGLSRGMPEVDMVERIHMLEYGVLAFLFYRAFRSAGDLSVICLTLLSVTLVGTLEEWLQWYVSARVGEMRDVALNVYAGLCGLVVSLSLCPLWGARWHFLGSSRLSVGRFAAVVTLALGAFLHCAHLGYQIRDPQIGEFRSYFTARELELLRERRAEGWRRRPPASPKQLGREDYYMTEAASHVAHRNASLQHGDLYPAWQENRLLERYYDPFLDVRSFESGQPHRLAPAERKTIEEQRPQPDPYPYSSPVLVGRIFVSPSKLQHWTIVTAAVVALLAWSRTVSRGSSDAPRSIFPPAD